MKRGLRWIDGEDDDASSDSSTLDTDTEENNGASESKKSPSSKPKSSQGDSAKKQKGIDFEALSRHGYKGGLSVLNVPAPKEPEQDPDWTWSTGQDKRPKETEESFQERQKTRAALAEGEALEHALTRKEKKNLSFQQKEKRKRELGQASRGKNYVEEEKRVLRDSGIYSGFDA